MDNHTSSRAHRRGKTPSFSSILLDSIDKSMDFDTTTTASCHERFSALQGEDCQTQSQHQRRTDNRTKSQSTTSNTIIAGHNRLLYSEKPVNLKRAIMIEQWIEKYQQEEEELQQRIPGAAEHRRRHSLSHCNDGGGTVHHHRQKSVLDRKRHALRSTKEGSLAAAAAATTRSSSSSPESFFNSALGNYSYSSSCFTPQILPLKIKTSSISNHRRERSSSSPSNTTPSSPGTGRSEGTKFMARTRSRALKMYGDLKKKNARHQNDHNHHRNQAVSPGAKIASFLISMFAANKKQQHQKHARTVSDSEVRKPSHRSSPTTTTSSSCSSGSSFSRSCLSTKSASTSSAPPSVRPNRSVRFYPVSAIVDEDLRLCGQKCLKNDERNLNPKEIRIRSLFDSSVEALEDDDGEESCASSDLFELNNLNSVRVGVEAAIKCGGDEEELPVYGTTSLDQNRLAIARRGFIL